MADIISGTEMRAAILDELRQEVEAIREKHGTVPGLVTILVGENPASIRIAPFCGENINRSGRGSKGDCLPTFHREGIRAEKIHLGHFRMALS